MLERDQLQEKLMEINIEIIGNGFLRREVFALIVGLMKPKNGILARIKKMSAMTQRVFVIAVQIVNMNALWIFEKKG